MDKETRSLMVAPKLRADGEKSIVGGFAVRYNSETIIGGEFREQFAPGAFAEAIKGDVRALFNHDSSKVLGRTKSGTLRLSEGDSGLTYDLDLPDTTVGRDLRVSMDRGDIDGSSFAFSVIRQEWDDSGEMPLRTILEAGLAEVSPVTFPAYADSAIALRSLDEAREDAKPPEADKKADEYYRRKAEDEQKFRKI